MERTSPDKPVTFLLKSLTSVNLHVCLHFSFVQTTVTARNIVIAAGGRPNYPTHVSVCLWELFDLDACFVGEQLIKLTPSVSQSQFNYFCSASQWFKEKSYMGSDKRLKIMVVCFRSRERESTASPATISSGWKSLRGKREWETSVKSQYIRHRMIHSVGFTILFSYNIYLWKNINWNILIL